MNKSGRQRLSAIRLCLVSLGLLALSSQVALAAESLPKLAVMPLKAERVNTSTSRILDQLLVARLARLNRYEVISASDINNLLGYERLSAMIGCDDAACAAELSGAVEADYLLVGTVGILGPKLVVSLQAIDSNTSKVVGRVTAKVNNFEKHYETALAAAIYQLFDVKDAPDLHQVGAELRFANTGGMTNAWAVEQWIEGWGGLSDMPNPLQSTRAPHTGFTTPSFVMNERANITERREESDSSEERPIELIKGHLIHTGRRQQLSRYDHIGVRVGPSFLGDELYLNIDPGFAFYFDTWAMSVHAPLKLGPVRHEEKGFSIRSEEWDELADYAKVIRFLTIGRKEDRFYFTINSLRPSTLGHGQLINKYQGNVDLNRSLTGLTFDAYTDHGGFQLFLNDITFQNRIVGALAFLKPLSVVSDATMAKSLSIGFEYAADFHAPQCLLAQEDGPCIEPGTSAPEIDRNAQGLPFTQTTTVQAAGLSFEMKVWRQGEKIDLKLFGTYHRFLEDEGDGAAAGLLARLTFGQPWMHALRIRAEYRTHEDGFSPSYFDSLYEISKYRDFGARDGTVAQTKYQRVFENTESFGQRHGYNIETSWGLFKGSRSNKKVALGVGLSDTNGPNDSRFYAHLELPWLELVQVFGTYMRLNEDSLSDLFTDIMDADNAILIAGIRLKLLPILFINAHVSKSFQSLDTDDGNLEIALNDGEAPSSSGYRVFENIPTFYIEAELGWEFGNDS